MSFAFNVADIPLSLASQLLQGEVMLSSAVPNGRKAACGGKPLPLFWHCRVAMAGKAPVFGLFLIGMGLAKSILRKIRSPEGFPT
ncbi:hypothetical protein [Pseudomonas sp. A-B-19]|uniref:hypothetical protein n=1 Tax=Pseudomonas sp. A-B-19 TaxID=2832405 RepID=UPI001CBCF06A|nr:hypothetical protein [Pseudomonas sp. A-B-19]